MRRLLEAALSVETPAIVVDLALPRRDADRFLEFTQPEGLTACFAVKANRHPAILAELGRCGFGADVASEVELNAAVTAGLKPLFATNPGFSPAVLRGLDKAGATILADNHSQLRTLLDSAALERSISS